MADCKLEIDPLENEIRVALVGKTGVGKSATGNTILGCNMFESNPSTESVSRWCKEGSTLRFNRYLQVVDAPGFKDTSSKQNDYKIGQCVTMLSPGIHAILFVIRIGRFTEEDVQSANTFIDLFGSVSRKFVITVFTGADDLTEEYNLKRIIEGSGDFLKSFLRGSNNRYLSVNNKASSEEKETFVKELLDKIEEIQKENEANFYTSKMFEEAEVNMKLLDEKHLQEIEEENRERDEKMRKEAEAKYKAELDNLQIEKEEQIELLRVKRENIQAKQDARNAYEARLRSRRKYSSTFELALHGTVLGGGIGARIGFIVGGGMPGAAISATAGSVVGIIIGVTKSLMKD